MVNIGDMKKTALEGLLSLQDFQSNYNDFYENDILWLDETLTEVTKFVNEQKKDEGPILLPRTPKVKGTRRKVPVPIPLDSPLETGKPSRKRKISFQMTKTKRGTFRKTRSKQNSGSPKTKSHSSLSHKSENEKECYSDTETIYLDESVFVSEEKTPENQKKFTSNVNKKKTQDTDKKESNKETSDSTTKDDSSLSNITNITQTVEETQDDEYKHEIEYQNMTNESNSPLEKIPMYKKKTTKTCSTNENLDKKTPENEKKFISSPLVTQKNEPNTPTNTPEDEEKENNRDLQNQDKKTDEIKEGEKSHEKSLPLHLESSLLPSQIQGSCPPKVESSSPTVLSSTTISIEPKVTSLSPVKDKLMNINSNKSRKRSRSHLRDNVDDDEESKEEEKEEEKTPMSKRLTRSLFRKSSLLPTTSQILAKKSKVKAMRISIAAAAAAASKQNTNVNVNTPLGNKSVFNKILSASKTSTAMHRRSPMASKFILKAPGSAKPTLPSMSRIHISGTPSNIAKGVYSFLPSRSLKPSAEALQLKAEEEIRKKLNREKEALARKERLQKCKFEEKKLLREARVLRVKENKKIMLLSRQNSGIGINSETFGGEKGKGVMRGIGESEKKKNNLEEKQELSSTNVANKEERIKIMHQKIALKKKMEEAKERERILEKLEEEKKLFKEKEEAASQIVSSLNTTYDVSSSSSCVQPPGPTKNTTSSSSSYEMTPGPGEKSPIPLINENNYDIDGLRSDDETDDDEEPKKSIPEWAKGTQFRYATMKQYHEPIPLEELYSEPSMPDLSSLFKVHNPRFFTRTSSAIWHKPPKF